jgi:hypothetical protein
MSDGTLVGTAADPILVVGDIGEDGGHPDSVVEQDDDLQILESSGFQTPLRT